MVEGVTILIWITSHSDHQLIRSTGQYINIAPTDIPEIVRAQVRQVLIGDQDGGGGNHPDLDYLTFQPSTDPECLPILLIFWSI